MGIKAFRGLLSLLFLLVAHSIGGRDNLLPAMSIKPSDTITQTLGYTLYKGEIYKVKQTTTTYQYLSK